MSSNINTNTQTSNGTTTRTTTTTQSLQQATFSSSNSKPRAKCCMCGGRQRSKSPNTLSSNHTPTGRFSTKSSKGKGKNIKGATANYISSKGSNVNLNRTGTTTV